MHRYKAGGILHFPPAFKQSIPKIRKFISYHKLINAHLRLTELLWERFQILSQEENSMKTHLHD